MKNVLLVILFAGYAGVSAAQNIGIGNTDPQAVLDINGDLAQRTADITITNTYNYALDVNTVKRAGYKLLQNGPLPGNFILSGITAGVDGRIINLYNRSGSAMEIYDEDINAAIADRIHTGTGGTFAIYNGGTVTLKYDTSSQHWEVTGSHYNSLDYFGGGGGGGTSYWDLNGAAISNNNAGNVGIGTNAPLAKLHVMDDDQFGGTIRVGALSSAAGHPKLIKFGDGSFVSVGEGATDDQMDLSAARFYLKTSAGGVGNVGIGTAANASLSVARGTGTDGTAAFFGTTNASHFNYSVDENTYLRGGKSNSKLFLNDYGGQVAVGTSATGTAQMYIVGHQTGAAANGLSILQTTTNTGNESYGLALNVNGSNIRNFGILADVGGTGQYANNAGLFRANTGTPVGLNIGVEGQAANSTINNYAGKFTASGGSISTVNYAVNATANGPGDNYGVYGYATTSNTQSSAAYGVYGKTDPTLWYGYAGYFDGYVHVNGPMVVDGNLYCNYISKGGGSFKIDHPQDPENKYLYHSFVESPDMMNIYNGNITTDNNGMAVVHLPEYFTILNKDYRYQLTVVGQFAQAIVFEKINNNQFKIRTDKPDVEVSWMVTGIRQDAWANANRIVPEVEKEARNKGKYLAPDAFNKPKEQGIFYQRPASFAK